MLASGERGEAEDAVGKRQSWLLNALSASSLASRSTILSSALCSFVFLDLINII